MKNVNYTADLTAQIISDYQSGTAVEDIASAIDKSVRSVRSKLVREGVYVATPKAKARKKDEPTTKSRFLQRKQRLSEPPAARLTH
jgi:hypothetical protein